MALLDRIKFDPESDDWFVWKFPSDNIKMGSHLVVNEAQEAVLFRGGQAFDVFGPGTFALMTSNNLLLYCKPSLDSIFHTQSCFLLHRSAI